MKKRIVLSSLLVIVMLSNGFCLPAAFAEDTEATAASAALTRPVMHEPVLVEPGVVELSWEDMSGVNDAYTIVFWDGEQEDAISGNRYNVEQGKLYGFMRMNVVVEAYGPNDYETFTYTSDIVYYYEPIDTVGATNPVINPPVYDGIGNLEITWMDGVCNDERYVLRETDLLVTLDDAEYTHYDVTGTNSYNLPVRFGSFYDIRIVNVWEYYGHVVTATNNVVYNVPVPSVATTDPIVELTELQNNGSLQITWTNGVCSDSRYERVQSILFIYKDDSMEDEIDVTGMNSYNYSNVTPGCIYDIKVMDVYVYNGHVVTITGISKYCTPDETLITSYPSLSSMSLQSDRRAVITWSNGVYADPRFSLTDVYIEVYEDGTLIDSISGNHVDSVIGPVMKLGCMYSYCLKNVFTYNGAQMTITSAPNFYYIPDPETESVKPILYPLEVQDDGSLLLRWDDGSYGDSRFFLASSVISVQADGEYLDAIYADGTNSAVFSEVEPGVEYTFTVNNIFVYNGESISVSSYPRYYTAPFEEMTPFTAEVE